MIEKERMKTGIPISEATQIQMLQMVDEMKLDASKYDIKWSVTYNPDNVDSQGW